MFCTLFSLGTPPVDIRLILHIIPHGVRNLDDELYFRQSAEKLLSLMTQSQKKPVHRNARHLSVGEVGLLRCLFLRENAMSAGELGRIMDIGSGGVANLLNSLEKKGYIRRDMNPSDRRGIMVSLSDEGRRLAESQEKKALDLTRGLLERLGKDDTEQLIRIYQKMLDIAEDYLKNRCEETE